jgi:hypothetical protein
MKSILLSLGLLGCGIAQGTTAALQDPTLLAYLKGYAQIANRSCSGDLTAEKIVNPGFQ